MTKKDKSPRGAVSVDELPPEVRSRVMAQISNGQPAPPEPRDQKLEIQLLQERVLFLWRQHEDVAEQLGKALIAVREAMGWGHFQKWYEAKGLNKNRVNYCIRKAEGKVGKKFTGVSVISPPMLPSVYRIIYADPPWEYGDFASDSYTSVHDKYATMTLDEISKMKLPRTTKDAVLFMWTTAPYLFDSKKVLDAWEFKYATHYVWAKETRNGKLEGMIGHYSRVTHEILLVATKGSCQPDAKKRPSSVQSEPRPSELFEHSVRARRKHSEKPDHFRNLIDTLYPDGNRIELFARGKLPAKWDGWGNEYEPGPEQMKRELELLRDKRLDENVKDLFEGVGFTAEYKEILRGVKREQ